MKESFKISGMTCATCQNTVEKAVRKLPGVEDVSVSLMTNQMLVEFNPDNVNTSAIMRRVKQSGYKATMLDKAGKEPAVANEMNTEKASNKRLWLSLVFLILLFYVSMGDMIGLPLPSVFTEMEYSMHFALTQGLLTLPIIALNWRFIDSGIRHLIRLTPNMDSLVSIGALAAITNGVISLFVIASGLVQGDSELIHSGRMNLYFEAAAAILVFVSLGKYLESLSKSRSTTAIRQLLDLSPKTAWVKRKDDFEEIAAVDIMLGDLVLVKPGMTFPVDGTIVEGRTDIDESLITGENIPVYKKEGDSVISATINKTQAVQFRAEKVGSDTTIAKIIDLVETTIAKKMPIQKIADKISGVFVPIVFLISLISFGSWLLVGETLDVALSMAIAVLVISCPCALGLATPVAVMVAMGKGAEAGILIKNPDVLEIVHKISVVMLDKTGTITIGAPEVTDVIPFKEATASDLLVVAASLEQYSNHPIAKGITRFVEGKGHPLESISQMIEIPGKGIEGQLRGKRAMAGNMALFTTINDFPEALLSSSESLSRQGKTIIFIRLGNDFLGLIACQDQLRDDSIQAIASLRKQGLKTMMLTGDTPLAAEAIQKKLSLDGVYSEVKPEEKADIIRKMQSQGEVVAMVGDGINDAIALSEASVGIAIGAGSEVAIDSADIVLMHNDLKDVQRAIMLGKKTLNTIRTNLFWAFIYNLIGIPVAAGALVGWLNFRLSPMVAALAMSLSSVSVVLNALRLKTLKWRKRETI